MKISKFTVRFARIATVVMLTSAVSQAEVYQFIVSGYPVDNVSSSLASDVSSLATSTLATSSDATGLEARYRVWYESDGTALRSDKFIGMFLYIR